MTGDSNLPRVVARGAIEADSKRWISRFLDFLSLQFVRCQCLSGLDDSRVFLAGRREITYQDP